MAYRLEDRSSKSWSQIAICLLDDKLNPIKKSNKVIELKASSDKTDMFEDPRLFVHNGKLFMSFIAACIHEGRQIAWVS